MGRDAAGFDARRSARRVIRIGHRRPPCRQRRNAGGDAAVDGHDQARRARQVAADEREHGVGDVLGQHLRRRAACGSRRTRRAPRAPRRTPRPAARATPPAKMPEPSHDAVGVHAVDPDAVLARARRRAAAPGGPGRPWPRRRRRFRPGDDRVLRHDVDDVAARCPAAIIMRAAARLTRNEPRASTSCSRSQSSTVVSTQRLRSGKPGVVDDEVDAAEAAARRRRTRRRPRPRRVTSTSTASARSVADRRRRPSRRRRRRGRRRRRAAPSAASRSAMARPMPDARAGDERDPPGERSAAGGRRQLAPPRAPSTRCGTSRPRRSGA